MSANKIPHQIFVNSELNSTQDYPPENPMNSSGGSDEKISIINEFQLDIKK